LFIKYTNLCSTLVPRDIYPRIRFARPWSPVCRQAGTFAISNSTLYVSGYPFSSQNHKKHILSSFNQLKEKIWQLIFHNTSTLIDDLSGSIDDIDWLSGSSILLF
jgi:hypothetical protein